MGAVETSTSVGSLPADLLSAYSNSEAPRFNSALLPVVRAAAMARSRMIVGEIGGGISRIALRRSIKSARDGSFARTARIMRHLELRCNRLASAAISTLMYRCHITASSGAMVSA